MLPREALAQVEQISAWFSSNEIDFAKLSENDVNQRISDMGSKISQLDDLLDYNKNCYQDVVYGKLKGQVAQLKNSIKSITDLWHTWYAAYLAKIEYDSANRNVDFWSSHPEPGPHFDGSEEDYEQKRSEEIRYSQGKMDSLGGWLKLYSDTNRESLEANHKWFKDAILLSKEIIDKSLENKVDNGNKSNENRGFPESTSKVFKVCPYCGEKLGLPKNPVFCPYCGEKLS